MEIISEETQFQTIIIEDRDENQPQSNWRFWCLLSLLLMCLFCGLIAASAYYTMETKTEPPTNPQNIVSSTPINNENTATEKCKDADCIRNWIGETTTEAIKSIENY